MRAGWRGACWVIGAIGAKGMHAMGTKSMKALGMRVGLAAGLAFGLMGGLMGPALAQEAKSGLEAMGVDPAAAGQEGVKGEDAGIQPEDAAGMEAPALAAPVGEGQAIMERARDRIRRMQFATFDARMYGTGPMEGYTTAASGRVVLRRAPGNAANPWMFRVTGSTDVKAGGTAMMFDMAMRANSREWVNHEERTVHETLKMAPGGKWLTVPNSLWPTEVFERAPYGRVLRSATFEQEPGQEINGVVCDVVVVESKPARGAASRGRWYIGQEDSFPRRFERLVTMQGEESMLVMEFSNLRIEDSVPADVTEAMLRVEVPTGYDEKRQSPPTPAPAPAPSEVKGDAGTDAGAMNGDKGMEGAMGGGSGGAGGGAGGEPARPAAPVMAPEFELAKIDGTKVSLASMRGSVVVVDFFGTWAMASEAWHPKLKQIVAGHEGVKIVPVSIRQRDPQLAAELLRRAEIGEALLIGNEGVAQAYGVQVYPAAAVVAADGRLIEVVQGCGSAASEEALRGALERAKGGAASEVAKEESKDPKGEEKGEAAGTAEVSK